MKKAIITIVVFMSLILFTGCNEVNHELKTQNEELRIKIALFETANKNLERQLNFYNELMDKKLTQFNPSSWHFVGLTVEPSDVIAFSSMLIALFTFVCLILQNHWTKDYNRRSVKPILITDILLIKGEPLGIKIRNSGLGPAIIKKMICVFDEKKLNVNSVDDYQKLLIQMKLPIDDNVPISYYPIEDDFAVRPGEQIFLLKFEDNLMNTPLTEEWVEKFNRLKTTIIYESIYGCSYQSIVE